MPNPPVQRILPQALVTHVVLGHHHHCHRHRITTLCGAPPPPFAHARNPLVHDLLQDLANFCKAALESSGNPPAQLPPSIDISALSPTFRWGEGGGGLLDGAHQSLLPCGRHCCGALLWGGGTLMQPTRPGGRRASGAALAVHAPAWHARTHARKQRGPRASARACEPTTVTRKRRHAYAPLGAF